MYFSILIPVYNAEKYIDQCIESVIDQSEQDFEIVIVDDGSKDASVDICKRWASKYPDSIRVIEKENSGSLLTRRRCLEESRGEYIYMIDADDHIIDNDALRKIKALIEKTKCDLVFFNATADTDKLYPYNFDNEQVFEEEGLKKIYDLILQTKYMNSLWNKVFHRTLVDWDVDYEEYKKVSIGTDFFQGFPIISNASKIVYSDEIYYYYRKTAGSIVHKFNDNLSYSLKAGHMRLVECTKRWKYVVPDMELKLANRYMLTASTMAFKGRLLKERSKIYDFVKSIGEDSIFIDNYAMADLKNLNRYRKIIIKLLAHKCYRLISFILPVFKNYGI